MLQQLASIFSELCARCRALPLEDKELRESCAEMIHAVASTIMLCCQREIGLLDAPLPDPEAINEGRAGEGADFL